MQANRLITLTLAASVLMACDNLQQAQSAEPSDNLAQVAESLTDKTLRANQAAYIPPQCYTKTRDANGQVHNPCMSCHIPSTEPNYLNDGNLQLGYDFADYARTNHWRNLFKDRRTAIATISDQSILDDVRQNNYQSPTGVLDLAAKLAQVPNGWDFDQDGQWSGYKPDAEGGMDADDPAETVGVCQRNERFAYVTNPSRFLGYASYPAYRLIRYCGLIWT